MSTLPFLGPPWPTEFAAGAALVTAPDPDAKGSDIMPVCVWTPKPFAGSNPFGNQAIALNQTGILTKLMFLIGSDLLLPAWETEVLINILVICGIIGRVWRIESSCAPRRNKFAVIYQSLITPGIRFGMTIHK